MAFTERYANFDLATGLNDGTSEANAWQSIATVIANVAAGNRVNIKQQAIGYDLTASVDFNVAGTATAPIYYRGYEITIGDGGMWEVLYNSTGVVTLSFTGSYNIVENISFLPGTSSNLNGFIVGAIGSWVIKCIIETAGPGDCIISNTLFNDITLKGNGQARVGGPNSFNTIWMYNKIERTTATTDLEMLRCDTYGISFNFIGNLIIGNGNSGENGLFLDRADSCKGLYIINNKFYNLDSGIVIDEEPNAGFEHIQIINNIFSTMTTYGIERTNTETGFVKIINNFYHSCTTAFTNYSTESTFLGNTSLTTSPFVTAGSDFTINETANAGRTVRDSGFPVNNPYDWTNMAEKTVYEGPTATEIATAVWTRNGRTLT